MIYLEKNMEPLPLLHGSGGQETQKHGPGVFSAAGDSLPAVS